MAQKLEQESSRRLLVAIVVVLPFAASWTWWFTSSLLDIVETSSAARLEFGGTVIQVQAPVGAVLESLEVRTGERVIAGQLVARLDARHLRDDATQLTEALLSRQMETAGLELQASTERGLRGAEERLYESETAHLREKLAGEESALRFALEEATRVAKLAELGLYPELDRLRNQAALLQKENSVQVIRRDLDRQRADHEARALQGAARAERLEQQRMASAGEEAAIRHRLDAIAHEILERQLRAPSSGTVGRSLEHPLGAYIPQGDSVVEIAPESGVQVVAFFPPKALGRLRAGQRARVRLDLGDLAARAVWSARVERVETEPDERGVRVHLTLTEANAVVEELRHGTSAQVEVVVAEMSPLHWAARRVARVLGSS